MGICLKDIPSAALVLTHCWEQKIFWVYLNKQLGLSLFLIQRCVGNNPTLSVVSHFLLCIKQTSITRALQNIFSCCSLRAYIFAL